MKLTEIEEASFEFIRSFVRKSLIAIFKIHSKIAIAEEKDQKKKLIYLREQVDKNMRFFTTIYNKLVDSTQPIFKTATQTVKRVFKDAETLHKEENKESDKAKNQYIAFQDKLFEVSYV